MHQFGTEVDYSLSKHQEEEELLKRTVALQLHAKIGPPRSDLKTAVVLEGGGAQICNLEGDASR